MTILELDGKRYAMRFDTPKFGDRYYTCGGIMTAKYNYTVTAFPIVEELPDEPDLRGENERLRKALAKVIARAAESLCPRNLPGRSCPTPGTDGTDCIACVTAWAIEEE